MTTLAVFPDGHWVRIDDERVVARGRDAWPTSSDARVVAVIGANDVSIRSAALGELTDAQANAAARVATAETSLNPTAALHAAAGLPDQAGRRLIVTVSATRITDFLTTLAEQGVDPDHIVASPMLLPRPDPIDDIASVRGRLAGETVVRGATFAFADDPVLTPLLTAGVEPLEIDGDALEAAVVAALVSPEADLRHGVFAKRRPFTLASTRMRRLATMALVLGLIVLAAHLVLTLRTNARAAAIEAEARTLAAAVLPPGTVVTDPVAQTDARLAEVGYVGGGFNRRSAAFAEAIATAPDAELVNLTQESDGSMRATIRAADATQLDAIVARLRSAGLAIVAGETVTGQGRPSREVTVPKQ